MKFSMGDQRALVLASVIAIRDNTFYYAFCKVCYCKIYPAHGSKERTSFQCRKCGCHYATSEVNYRYRLHLSVSDRGYTSDVTIFGKCLEPVFGIPASDLQRMMAHISQQDHGVQSKDVLYKAVEECLIGSVYLFGFKSNVSTERSASQKQYHSPVRLEAIVKDDRGGINEFADKTAIVAYQMVRLDGQRSDATVFSALNQLLLDSGNSIKTTHLVGGDMDSRERSSSADFINVMDGDGESGYLTKENITITMAAVKRLSASDSLSSLQSLWGQSLLGFDESLECKLSLETTNGMNMTTDDSTTSSDNKTKKPQQRCTNINAPRSSGIYATDGLQVDVTNTDTNFDCDIKVDPDIDVDNEMLGEFSDTGIGDSSSSDYHSDNDSHLLLQLPGHAGKSSTFSEASPDNNGHSSAGSH
ncbi:uncharacterized protein [Ptychodera flava]|uniref:uncharacterized protein n=1 Tax=Ptychodera flava TaxID=63121 RepID=UPI00396A727C